MQIALRIVQSLLQRGSPQSHVGCSCAPHPAPSPDLRVPLKLLGLLACFITRYVCVSSLEEGAECMHMASTQPRRYLKAPSASSRKDLPRAAAGEHTPHTIAMLANACSLLHATDMHTTWCASSPLLGDL